MSKPAIALLAATTILLSSCPGDSEPQTRYITKTIEVTASAYNSLHWQTEGNPNITAFGDTLKPGMKVIAVSRDLLDSGLVHNTQLTIDNLPGVYTVKDKMHSKHRRKIDIYMGTNLDSARNWGRRKVKITWVTDSVVE